MDRLYFISHKESKEPPKAMTSTRHGGEVPKRWRTTERSASKGLGDRNREFRSYKFRNYHFIIGFILKFQKVKAILMVGTGPMNPFGNPYRNRPFYWVR